MIQPSLVALAYIFLQSIPSILNTLIISIITQCATKFHGLQAVMESTLSLTQQQLTVPLKTAAAMPTAITRRIGRILTPTTACGILLHL